MAEENNAAAATSVAATESKKAEPKKPAARKAATKAAPKRKPAAKKATAKKTTVRKTAAKKAAVKKTAVKKPSPKMATRKASTKSVPEFAARAQEAGRKAFLAHLGFYGKAFDQAQEQFNQLQDQLEERRTKANELYLELVKRGEKVEAVAKDAIDDIELPELKLESLTDRANLDAQLRKARARFNELKSTVGFKSAA